MIVVVLAAGAVSLASASAAAAAGRCVSGQTLPGCASGIGSGLLNPSQCQSQTADPRAAPPAQAAADRLQNLIDYVPCPETGRISFNTRDDRGDSMSVLDAIADPAGGYLGVYHTEFQPPGRSGTSDFRIAIAHSGDLIHWARIAILDPSGASMPTLQATATGRGYLLAYEKRAPDGGGVVRIRYYPGVGALLGGRFTAQRDLPRTLSPFNEGTPTILWDRWNGALDRSVIALGFHYETAPGGQRGPDREAFGTLRRFRFWSPRTDPATDAALDRQGLGGSHGGWRQFGFGGGTWRVYEAQTAFENFGTWRVVLASTSSRQMYPVTLTMGARPVSSSYANPVVHLLPAPSGHGQVLMVTMFLFAAGGPEATGELVYYQPL